jgi:hypothetical protein
MSQGGPRYVRTTGFVLTARVDGDADRIEIAGELTAVSAGLLDAETVRVCRSPAGPDLDLVLDLTQVTFLDVMGVAALRRTHYRAALRGRLRIGLPIAAEPGRLLDLAVDNGWLPPAFHPGITVF